MKYISYMGLTQQLENDRLVRGGFVPIINPMDLLKYVTEKPQRMAKDMVDKIIDTTVDTAVDGVKRLVKRTKPVKKQLLSSKGGMIKNQAINILKENRGCSNEIANKFLEGYRLDEVRKVKLLKDFDEWDAKQKELKTPKKKKKSKPSEEKEGKEEMPPPPLVISVDDPALPPASAPGPVPPPRLVPGVFRLSEKEFDNIKNTKPRLEYRRILKDFFNELSITSWGSLPGNFVNDINNLGLRSGSRADTIDKLRSTLSSYKTLISKREPGKETTVKIKVAAAKKPKKAPKKKALAAVPRGTVRKLPAIKKPRKPRKPKKAKRGKKGSGNEAENPINVLI